MKRLLLMIGATLSLAAPCWSQGQTTTPASSPMEAGDGLQLRFFQLNYRPALATVELVKSVLSPRGTVLPETRLNKLVVKDTAEALTRVEKLLEQSDLPSPIVRIELSSNSQLPIGGYQAGVRLTPRGRVVGQAQTVQSNTTSATTQFLLVMSGEKGHILVGEQMPYVEPYWNYVNGLGLVPPGVIFQSVSTGFSVEPLVMGQNIKVTITPYISYLSPNGPGQIEIVEAASTVVLGRGQSITLAASTGSSQSQQRAFGLILGSARQQRSQTVELQLSADLSEN